MDDVWLVIPVKRWADAKQRLASVLSPQERFDLAAHLTDRTFRVVARAMAPVVWVVTRELGAADLARQHGFGVLDDPGGDHSAALRHTAEHADGAGAAGIATLAIDLPRLQSRDVRALLAAAAPHTLVIAPDRAGTGTNAIAVAPPRFPFAFGPSSLERHLASARSLGLAIRILHRRGLACDVDESGDLDLLQGDLRLPEPTPSPAARGWRDCGGTAGESRTGDAGGVGWSGPSARRALHHVGGDGTIRAGAAPGAPRGRPPCASCSRVW
jgi:2-phospho-L-lactate/phosphoenolpyruvate guanylyltransferase